MAVNKVIYGNETLIDITDTTATDSTVLEGTVFYNAAGVRTVGSALAGISDVRTSDGISVVSSGIATLPKDTFNRVDIHLSEEQVMALAQAEKIDPNAGTIIIDENFLTAFQDAITTTLSSPADTVIDFSIAIPSILSSQSKIDSIVNLECLHSNSTTLGELGSVEIYQGKIIQTNNFFMGMPIWIDIIISSNFIALLTYNNNLEETARVDGLDFLVSTGAQQGYYNFQADWNETNNTSLKYISNKPAIPSATSDLTNNSGFITLSDVPQEICTIKLVSSTSNTSGYYSADKTFDEIASAIASGKTCTLRDQANDYLGTFIYGDYANGDLERANFVRIIQGTNFVWFQKAAADSNGVTLNMLGNYINTANTLPHTIGESGQVPVATGEDGNLVWASLPSTYSDVGAASVAYVDAAVSGIEAAIPTKVSELTNDAGYISSYTETDPTVPSWAKAQSKPTYTASEVGALPDSTTYVSTVNGQSGAVTVDAPFWVTLTGHSDGTGDAPCYWTKDKTFAEIQAAWEARKTVLLYIDGNNALLGGSETVGILQCMLVQSQYAYFSNMFPQVVPTGNLKCIQYTGLRIKSDESIIYNISSQSASGAQFVGFPQSIIVTNSLPRTLGTAGQIPVSQGTGTLKWVNPPTVPTNTSDLTNDSGFITSNDIPVTDVQDAGGTSLVSSGVATIPSIPTKTSDLTNDSGFITSASIPQEVFVFNVTRTGSSDNYSYVKDKTYAEILAAAQSGKLCVLMLLEQDLASAPKNAKPHLLSSSPAVGSTSGTGTLYFTQMYNLTSSSTQNALVSPSAIKIMSTEEITQVTFTVRLSDTYSPSSTNAMSGIAVASALSSLAIPSAVSELTNDSGYLTLADLPIYDGSVS